MKDYILFNSTQHIKLGNKLKEQGVNVGKCTINTFSDGEHTVQFEESVRGKQVFILGTTTHSSIMETLLMLDAAKRAAASKIVLVAPYYGYSRQDRKEGLRGPIGARLVADLVTTAGASEIVSIDLHAAQIQGFFNIPFDHIEGHSIMVPYLTKNYDLTNTVICTPDAGGFVRASKMAEKLGLPIVAINKHRDKPNSIGTMELVGDVRGKKIIIVDDMVDTAGTLCKAAEHLKTKGATSVIAVCTHGVLSGAAKERIDNSVALDELIVSDSLSTYGNEEDWRKLKVASCVSVLKEVLNSLATKQSINFVNK